jgi:trigger factor
MWKSVTALDSVDLCDYSNIVIPADVQTVFGEELQGEIDYYLSEHNITNKITNKALKDGDTVNIDYVGSVDEVEFEGGSTNGTGAEVTIGYTSYIDDFLEQLIGKMPGTTFNVEVTFPEDYGTEENGNAHLNGKDAVFVTTINHIVEYSDPTLNDAFVSENLSAEFGWMTVSEMKQGITEQIRSSKVSQFIRAYIVENSTVNTLPESLMTYQENSLILYYEEYAKQVNMEFVDFLTSYLGIADEAELIEMNKDANTESAEYYLLAQAIAEDAKLSVTDEDISEYFLKYVSTEDYSQFETFYGKPYLKLMVLNQLILDYVESTATVE